MGELIAGTWRTGGIETVLSDGTLRRPPSVFRDRITAHDGPFQAEAGRYHLYVSLACPWAHRTLIIRSLKGLAPMVGLSVTHWLMGEDGWTFATGPGVIPDTVNGVTALHQLYTLADPDCTTRVTVPLLWDKATGRIVSNESAEILRMFNSAFDALGAAAGDYYPEAHRAEIDAVNERIYANLNNGVYRAGFATTQEAYETAANGVFDTFDWLEKRLAKRRFLVGDTLSEADIRLFTTLVRFDAVYHGHFKCNRRALVAYPALWAYTRDLYQNPAIRPTIDLGHIKGHYYGSHPLAEPGPHRPRRTRPRLRCPVGAGPPAALGDTDLSGSFQRSIDKPDGTYRNVPALLRPGNRGRRGRQSGPRSGTNLHPGRPASPPSGERR